MDINDRLHEDHVEIKFLLKEIEKTTTRSCDKRHELFHQLKSVLATHRKLEDGVFYANLRKAKDAKFLLVEALNEHHLSSIVLEDLDCIPIEKRMWMGKFCLLKEIIEHHIKEEETELFARAKKLFQSDEAAILMAELEARAGDSSPWCGSRGIRCASSTARSPC